MLRFTRIFFPTSLILQVLALILLATSSELILKPVLAGGGLTWGNLLTWLLFTFFPTNFLLIRRQSNIHPVPQKVYYAFVYAGMIFGFLWIFVSYFLSGNWSATFSEENTKAAIWQYYTYATPLMPFIGYFLMRMLMVFFKKVR